MNTYDTFVTVVRLGSFSAAAKKLHRSPSAISKSISLLEQRLNVQLFDRTTRTLAVTEAGKLYFERCQDISQRIANAESELLGFSGEPSGNIRITWPNIVSSSNVIDVLSEFSELYPNIKVDVHVDNERVNLIDESMDFAFRLAPLANSSMIAIELFNIAPIICASPDYVERHGMPSDISALANMPLLLLNYANLIQKSWKVLPGLQDLDIKEHHCVNDINALYSMTKKGMGATFLFQHTIERDLKDGSLINILPSVTLPKQPVYLMYHQFNYTPKKMRVFIDHFKKRYLSK